MDKFVEKELNGWGRYRGSRSHIYRPDKVNGIAAAVRSGKESSYIGRGLGQGSPECGRHLRCRIPLWL